MSVFTRRSSWQPSSAPKYALNRRGLVRQVTGTIRVGQRTKLLVKRLQPGDIAVINHIDIDRIAAEALVACKPAAILNAAPSISGRYPAMGALRIAEAQIPLIDNLGESIMDLPDGTQLFIDGSDVVVGSGVHSGKQFSGEWHSSETLQTLIEAARAGLSVELQAFAENTLDYVRRESHLLFDPPNPPDLGVDFKGRPAMVVVRGQDFREDLVHLRSYVREMRPVILAVDGGADACLQEGLTPDVIIGDFDSVSSEALDCGARLVVHAYVGGDAPGAQRLEQAGLEYEIYEGPGTSEDVAMLMAYDKGAELIVAVGTHASMIEFLEKGRDGMASTFLTRLKVGPILVDAKGVSRLYRARVRKSDIAFLIGAGMVAFTVMALVSYPFRTFLSGGWFLFEQLLDSVNPFN